MTRSRIKFTGDRRRTRGGFTLIEMLIVIGIVLVLSALVLSGFGNAGSNNRRQSCQSNLAQIYQSCRLYQQDEGAFPFHSVGGDEMAVTGIQKNIGLWALYAFHKKNPDSTTNINEPSRNDKDGNSQAVGRYLRSAKVLHCPQDDAGRELIIDGDLNIGRPKGDPGGGIVPGNSYLSYQKFDPSNGQPLYQSVRTTSQANMEMWKRQLVTFKSADPIDRVYRQPADDTIVTWCPFHRPNGRDFDNVLFYDGSIQLILKAKDNAVGWQRTPKPPI